jgi:hypothetical protein
MKVKKDMWTEICWIQQNYSGWECGPKFVGSNKIRVVGI